MNPLQLTTLTLAFLVRTAFAAQDLDHCDELFDQRADLARATEAVACYSEYLAEPGSEMALRKSVYSNVFTVLSRIFNQASGMSARRNATDLGFDFVKDLERELPKSGLAPYWKAVFMAFDCKLKDSGRVVPTCILGKKDDISALLQQTMSTEPYVEGYGADRVYGVMMREMPGIAGGDKQASLTHLKRAWENAPNYSSNSLEYARTLFVLRRPSEARNVLQGLVSSNCVTMNPLLALECTEDQEAARNILQ